MTQLDYRQYRQCLQEYYEVEKEATIYDARMSGKHLKVEILQGMLVMCKQTYRHGLATDNNMIPLTT
jgi:hypothetical protein